MKILPSIYLALLLPCLAQAHGTGGPSQSGTMEGYNNKIELNLNRHSSLNEPENAETYKMDMKLSGKEIRLYITNIDGHPADISLSSAKAFIKVSGKTLWFDLTPVKNQYLAGTGNFNPDKSMQVDITLRMPGQRPVNKHFTPLKE